jgi:hypothetical protein
MLKRNKKTLYECLGQLKLLERLATLVPVTTVAAITTIITTMTVGATTAKAQATPSHDYLNTYRSSAMTHIFVSQSIEGEYGDVTITNSKSTGLTAAATPITSKWRGYNLTQTFGLEVLKFVQFNVAHSMMNMRSSSSGLERLGGSRFSGGMRLVFLAPVANLEAGGGVIGSRYDYQHDLTSSDFYGSGVYYSLGFNYFMSDKVSLFGQAKMIDEHAIRTGGNAEEKSISAKMTNIGFGFTLWI